jgi:hypothetical protein
VNAPRFIANYEERERKIDRTVMDRHERVAGFPRKHRETLVRGSQTFYKGPSFRGGNQCQQLLGIRLSYVWDGKSISELKDRRCATDRDRTRWPLPGDSTGGGLTSDVRALDHASTKDVASLNRDLPLIPEEPQVGRLVHLRVCLKLPASSVVNQYASSLDSQTICWMGTW